MIHDIRNFLKNDSAERANVLTHLPGIIFILIAGPFLFLQVPQGESKWQIAFLIYSFSFLFVFTSSTVYHLIPFGKVKTKWQIIDHIAIYFLIAGTYTPFVAVALNNQTGHNILLALWSLTLLGSFMKLFFTGKYEWFSLLLYLVMGWMLLFGGMDFIRGIPSDCLPWVIAGGLLYTGGIIFYRMEKHLYHHAWWHLCVLAAAICHFIGIWKLL